MHRTCHSSRGAFAFDHWDHRGHAAGYFRRPKYNVPLNSIDHGTHYEIQVFAIGFGKEHIKLSVVDDILYINGEKELPESGSPNFSRQEFPIKSFERMLRLPQQVDVPAISAKHENGVLLITLPKTIASQANPQEIPVN